MSRDCLLFFSDPENQKKIFGEELDSKKIKYTVDAIERIKKMNNGDIKSGKGLKELRAFFKNEEKISALVARERAVDAGKIKSRRQFREQPSYANDPVEAFAAQVAYGVDPATGADLGIQNIIAAEQQSRLSFLNSRLTALENMGVKNFDFVAKHELAIYQMVSDMEKGIEPHPMLLKKNPPEVLEFAKIVHENNERNLMLKQAAGIPIDRTNNFVAHMDWNPNIVRSVSKEKFVRDLGTAYNNPETLGNAFGDAAKTKKFFEAVYDSIISGKFGLDGALEDADIGDKFLTFGVKANLGDVMSAHRVLVPGHITHHHRMSTLYSGTSLLEKMIKGVNIESKRLALYREWGNQPRANFLGDIERTQARLDRAARTEATPGKATKIADTFRGSQKRLVRMWDQATQEHTPGSNMLHNITQGILAAQVASKLGKLGTQMATNTGIGGIQEAITSGNRNIFLNMSKHFFESVKELPEATRKVWLKEQLSFGEEAIVEMQKRMGVHIVSDTGEAPTIKSKSLRFKEGAEKLATLMMKLNGSDITNEAIGTVATQRYAKNLAQELSSKDWGSMDVNTKASLLRMGIKEGDLKFLKMAIEETEGVKVVTPEAIRDIPLDVFREHVKSSKLPYNAEQYRHMLEVKYRAGLIDKANNATTTVGARESSFFNVADAGTGWGLINRVAVQFKTFTAQWFNQADRFTQKQVVVGDSLRSGGRDYAIMAQSAAMMYGLGALVYKSKQLLSGQFEDAQKFEMKDHLGAINNAGFIGFFGDIVTTDWNKMSKKQLGFRTASDTFLGPTFGNISSVGIGISSATKGSKGMAMSGKIATDIVRKNAPFQNYPVVGAGYDWLQNTINEGLDPGMRERARMYQQKQRTKAKLER